MFRILTQFDLIGFSFFFGRKTSCKYAYMAIPYKDVGACCIRTFQSFYILLRLRPCIKTSDNYVILHVPFICRGSLGSA